MKKHIKITEKQAKLLGLINEEDEIGVKSLGTSIGEVIIRIVISGELVPKFKDRILQLIHRQDKDANVMFYDATNKIVGTVKEIKLGSIKRDIKALDPTIMVEKKPIVKSLKEGVKNVVQITKSQYNRIFTNNLITENTTEIDNSLKKETIELIKYLYRKTDELSSFWTDKGLTYDDICDFLLSKNLIIKKDGKYELSKTLGTPEKAISSLQNELQSLLSDNEENVDNKEELELETEESEKKVSNDSSKLHVLTYNDEIAILRDPQSNVYVFYYMDIDKKEFAPYASLTRHYRGKDEDGDPQYEYDEDFDIDANTIENYVNDNIKSLKIGEGLEAYESGDYDIVKVDEALKNDLVSIYSKDRIINVLNSIFGPKPMPMHFPTSSTKKFEEESEDLNKIAKDKLTKSIPVSTNTVKKTPEEIKKAIASLRDKELNRRKNDDSKPVGETTGAASSGSFSAPMSNSDELENSCDASKTDETPIIDEITTTVSAGNFRYDTPGLANISRDGKFLKGPKTKAQTKTQYPNGKFVKNNAITESNEIFEIIAKKTGKTVIEVKNIIESKINKGK